MTKSVVITEAVFEARLATYTSPLAGLKTTPSGPLPTATVATTLLVEPSMTEVVFEGQLVT